MTEQTQENKVNKLFGMLKEGVEKIKTSDDWKSILTFQAKFHNYSFKNVMLILLQRPSASRVASYTTWKKVGRQVVKGAKAINIMAPHTYKVKDSETEEEEEKLGFHQASVFDISDTKGEPVPSLNIQELSGDTEDYRKFYTLLKTISPVPVKEETITDGPKGYYHLVEDYIAVKKGMKAHQKCKTLVHEIAHSILHRLDKKDENRMLSRGDREIEAEGTAFVVLTYFGFDTSDYSFPYVATWSKSAEPEAIEKAGATIQKTADALISKIEMKMAESKEEAVA